MHKLVPQFPAAFHRKLEATSNPHPSQLIESMPHALATKIRLIANGGQQEFLLRVFMKISSCYWAYQQLLLFANASEIVYEENAFPSRLMHCDTDMTHAHEQNAKCKMPNAKCKMNFTFCTRRSLVYRPLLQCFLLIYKICICHLNRERCHSHTEIRAALDFQ